MSKFYLKKFLLSDKTRSVKELGNKIIFDKNETLVPIDCRTHDFIPQCLQSFEKSSTLLPIVDFGFLKLKNETA